MNQRTLKSGDLVTITIDNIAFGGEGVGRYQLDDRAFTIFVDNTAIGDEVKIRIGSRKKSYAVGYVEEFVQRSKDRIKPLCKHFGLEGDRCGGCTLQFYAYDKQLKIKEQQVKDAITRIGGFDAEVVRPIIGCDSPWYYRNKMEFSFSRAQDEAGTLGLGLHIKRMHHDVVPLTECFLMNESVGPFVADLRSYLRSFELEKGKIEGLKSLVLREGKNTGELMVNLQCENMMNDNLVEEFLRFVLDFGKKKEGKANVIFGERLKSVYFTNFINIKGRPKKVQEKLLWGSETIKEIINFEGRKFGLRFEISPQSFFQPNTMQAEKLFQQAIDAAGLTGKETVYDLYCGAGTISLAIAHEAGQVYGIEINKSAIENARVNAVTNNISNVTFLEGDVLYKMPDLPEPADAVIVDPPRAGLAQGVIERIGEMRPNRIVYVSCNPATLARDLFLFKKTGYTLSFVQPVDMFPQTYHIENVALLTI